MGVTLAGRGRSRDESSQLIELRALGTAAVRDANGVKVAAALAEPKRFAVLLYLVLARPHGFHHRDDLIARFWPNLDTDRGRGELHRCVQALRRAVGPGVLGTRRGEEEIRVLPGAVSCDAVRFQEALESGRPVDAMKLYRGDLAVGLSLNAAPAGEDWLVGERARLRALAAGAARMLSAEYEAAHHVTQAVALARRAADLAPDDERVWRELIALLGRVGDRAGSMNAYGRLLKRLPGEPSLETVELVDSIRARVEHPVERGRELTPPFGTMRTISARVAGPPADYACPRAVGDYRIDREVARDELVTEALAIDSRTGEYVVVKLLRPLVAKAVNRKRFEAAMQPAVALAHPNLVPVLGAATQDGLVYYVTPDVRGDSVRGRLRRDGRFSVADAVRVTELAAEALEHAHRCGVIHGHLRPDSILVHGHQVAVRDVGVAPAVRASILDDSGAIAEDERSRIALALAAPGYMTPEQARGDASIDGRADVYALACVLFEMLSGASPFRAPTRQGTVSRQIVGAVPPIELLREEVPDAMAAVLRRALALDPRQRYASSGEFGAELRAAAERPRGWLSRVRRLASDLARLPLESRFLR